MKKFVSLLAGIVCATNIMAQIETATDLFFNGMQYDVLIIKVDNVNSEKFTIIENKNSLPHAEFMSFLSQDLSFLAINAGISDSNCSPIGYYVNNYKEIKPVNLNDGVGNFYLKPNGAFLFAGSEAIICESSQIFQHKNVRVGMQSGPMLLLNGAVNSQFNPTSQNKHIRCGVGVFINKNREQFLVFAISKEPVTFYDFAIFFNQKYGCTEALCLESQGCGVNLPYISEQGEGSERVICKYWYYSDN